MYFTFVSTMLNICARKFSDLKMHVKATICNSINKLDSLNSMVSSGHVALFSVINFNYLNIKMHAVVHEGKRFNPNHIRINCEYFMLRKNSLAA